MRRWREYWDPGRVALAVTVGPALVVPVLVLGWFVWTVAAAAGS